MTFHKCDVTHLLIVLLDTPAGAWGAAMGHDAASQCERHSNSKLVVGNLELC
jgi:hypothetical protein